ncbi:MAG: DUF115 domain-containing protein [Treponema sp.]|jgi:hypothetical protein|nr:DUF115 domain-containing protein [Treponema sp.]
MRETALVRNGKTLLSGIDPVHRAERTADAVSVKDRTLYFCPSPLYGYGLERLLERIETEAPNSAVLCVEAEGELYELSEKNIPPSLAANKKFRITNICGGEGLCAFIRETWGARAFRRVETVRFTGGWQLYPELYDSLCEDIRREIAVDWSNALTLTKLGRLYIRNALRNLSLVPRFPSISNFSFGEASVLVLGAGPSLDETLDALASRFKEKLSVPESRAFKIICVDTCLGALKERNITPDLAVILESQHWNLRDFIGCRGWEVPAAFDLSALPESAEILGGEGFLFMTPWTPLRIFERLKTAGLLPAVIPPLGSVGLSAVEIARRVSRGKIICAGLDFSFTQDKYHAGGTPGHREKLNAHTRLHGIMNAAAFNPASIAAESKSGFSVRTNPAMQNYRDLFEREFAGDPRLFDIEGSGLPLGIKTLSLDEALSLLEKRGIFTAELHREEKPDLLTEKVQAFVDGEKKRLNELRDILTSEAAAYQRLSVLIDECDYLWAHFPDYSGGRRPPMGEIASGGQKSLSFLKRLRSEIDPMLKLLGRVNNL